MDGQGSKKAKSVSRRKFIATSGAAGAAGAAATLFHAPGALAAADRTPGAVAPSAAGSAGPRSKPTVLHGNPAVSGPLDADLQATTSGGTSSFGRMFPSLPAHNPTDAALTALAATIPNRAPSANPDNPDIVAGQTYLGQFIDHDITFDQASALLGVNDPNGMQNTRTARYDLDSLYGGGPTVSPALYDPADPMKLMVVTRPVNIFDVPRDSAGVATIADPRNDQHKIILQLHVGFAKFHNNVVDLLRAQGTPEETLFETAQQTVRWHYQWIVVHEFLPNVSGQDVIDQVLVTTNGVPQVVTQYYQPTFDQAYMPVEFSVAAFRFGHSMIRQAYRINSSSLQQAPIFPRLNGGSPVAEGSKITWGTFFNIPGSIVNPQQSRKIDGHLAIPLLTLSGRVTGDSLMANLAERNMRRAKSFGLPSGQAVAGLMGAQVLTNAELGLTDPGFAGEAPLWFYILKEAEIQQNGRRLGEVGARIVAEVLLGILGADPNSYLNASPTFHPAPPLALSPNVFRMADLLLFAGALI